MSCQLSGKLRRNRKAKPALPYPGHATAAKELAYSLLFCGTATDETRTLALQQSKMPRNWRRPRLESLTDRHPTLKVAKCARRPWFDRLTDRPPTPNVPVVRPKETLTLATQLTKREGGGLTA